METYESCAEGFKYCQAWLQMTTAHFILNEEIKSAKRSVDGFDRLVSRAEQGVVDGALQKSPEFRADFFKRLNNGILADMSPVRSRYDASKSRRGVNNAFEANHVTVMEEPGSTGALSKLFRLVSIRLLVVNDEVVVEKLPLQAGFRFHVGQRFHLRGDVEKDYFHSIARSMLDWYYAVKIGDDLLEDLHISRFAVPGPSEDSLLLGDIDRTAGVPAGEHFRIRKNGTKQQPVPVSPYAQGLYVVNTFIGQYELRPEQKDLCDCFITWRNHFAKEYSAALERECWPFKAISPSSPSSHMKDDQIDAMAAFVLDKRALNAMQAVPAEWQTSGYGVAPSSKYEADYDAELQPAGMHGR